MLFSILGRYLMRTFSPRPTIEKEGGILVVRSSWRTALLTLGARSRHITVDPKLKVMRIIDRRFWFFTSTRRLEFDWIAQVILDDHDMSMGSNWYSYYQEDLLMIGLLLKDGTTMTLFRYWEQGDYVNNSIWPDWTRWEEFAVAAAVPGGEMASDASRLGYVLSGLIGVPFD
jgi:hypothetical protein